MKKLFKLICMIFLFMFVFSIVSYTISLLPSSIETVTQETVPIVNNEDFLLEVDQMALTLKENSLYEYYYNENYSSKDSLEHMYGYFDRTFCDDSSYTYTNEILIFITLKNDKNQYLTLNGVATFDSDNLIKLIMNWHDGVKIFELDYTNKITYYNTCRYFAGNSLSIENVNLGVNSIISGQYYNLAKLYEFSNNDIIKVGRALYNELFEVKKIEVSSSTGLGNVSLNIDYFDAMYNESLSYDRDNWGDTPFNNYYNNYVDLSVGYDDVIIIKSSYYNSQLLDYKYFLQIINISNGSENDINCVYLYEQVLNDFIFMYDTFTRNIESISYDLTNYVLVEESILLSKYLTHNDGLYFNENTRLYDGIMPDKIDFITWGLSDPLFINE